MDGETDLSILIRNLAPELHPGEYVFCSLKQEAIPAGVEPVAMIRENEGLTLVLSRGQAEQLGISFTTRCAWITLMVHSDLEVVGLTAAISKLLTDSNIPCNVVAGYYHDHLFVPSVDALKVMELLTSLSASG